MSAAEPADTSALPAMVALAHEQGDVPLADYLAGLSQADDTVRADAKLATIGPSNGREVSLVFSATEQLVEVWITTFDRWGSAEKCGRLPGSLPVEGYDALPWTPDQIGALVAIVEAALLADFA